MLQLKTALLLDGMHVFEHAIRVSPARGGGPLRSNDPDRVNKTIHVAGLPMEDIEEDVLAEFFSHCGEVCGAGVLVFCFESICLRKSSPHLHKALDQTRDSILG